MYVHCDVSVTFRNVCVQECIDPALLGVNKFDLRIYVLVESVMPLTAHICRSAMLRKCMEVRFPASSLLAVVSFLFSQNIPALSPKAKTKCWNFLRSKPICL
jgi:hypothetical protein